MSFCFLYYLVCYKKLEDGNAQTDFVSTDERAGVSGMLGGLDMGLGWDGFLPFSVR